MENRMDYDDFKEDFGSWANDFKTFIESEEFFKIYQKLKADAEKEIIVPKSDSTFRSFKSCPKSSVKVVWYLMDPYPRRYKNKVPQATGIPMSCDNSPDGKMQPSLELFYNAINDDLKKKVERNLSLEYLCKQGVLLLNTDLTCKLNKTGSHEGLWAPFQKYFLEDIMAKQTGIIYILSGKASLAMEKYIQPLGNYIIKTEHPAAASHVQREWIHKNVFSTINKIIHQNTGGFIYWDKFEYENVPF